MVPEIMHKISSTYRLLFSAKLLHRTDVLFIGFLSCFLLWWRFLDDPLLSLFDKNLLQDELNIHKRPLGVKENLAGKVGARSWVCSGAFSARIGGIFGVEVERGRFQ
jgi:hypothetical protein